MKNVMNNPSRGVKDTFEKVFKSNAVGEPPFNLGITAFMAISHAISACGPAYPALNAPATAERVLMAVQRVQDV